MSVLGCCGAAMNAQAHDEAHHRAHDVLDCGVPGVCDHAHDGLGLGHDGLGLGHDGLGLGHDGLGLGHDGLGHDGLGHDGPNHVCRDDLCPNPCAGNPFRQFLRRSTSNTVAPTVGMDHRAETYRNMDAATSDIRIAGTRSPGCSKLFGGVTIAKKDTKSP